MPPDRPTTTPRRLRSLTCRRIASSIRLGGLFRVDGEKRAREHRWRAAPTTEKAGRSYERRRIPAPAHDPDAITTRKLYYDLNLRKIRSAGRESHQPVVATGAVGSPCLGRGEHPGAGSSHARYRIRRPTWGRRREPERTAGVCGRSTPSPALRGEPRSMRQSTSRRSSKRVEDSLSMPFMGTRTHASSLRASALTACQMSAGVASTIAKVTRVVGRNMGVSPRECRFHAAAQRSRNRLQVAHGRRISNRHGTAA